MDDFIDCKLIPDEKKGDNNTQKGKMSWRVSYIAHNVSIYRVLIYGIFEEFILEIEFTLLSS